MEMRRTLQMSIRLKYGRTQDIYLSPGYGRLHFHMEKSLVCHKVGKIRPPDRDMLVYYPTSRPLQVANAVGSDAASETNW